LCDKDQPLFSKVWQIYEFALISSLNQTISVMTTITI